MYLLKQSYPLWLAFLATVPTQLVLGSVLGGTKNLEHRPARRMVPCKASEDCGVLYPRAGSPSGSGVAGGGTATASGASTTGTTGPQSRYLIIPKTGSSKKDTDSVSTDLKKMTKGKVYEQSDDNLGVLFWTASISPSNAKKLEDDHPILASVKPDKIISLQGDDNSSNKKKKRALSAEKRAVKHVKRDNLERDGRAPNQLKVVSQPSKDDKVSTLKNYVYRKEAGKGVTVYIFDDGVNKGHNEYKNQKGTKKWIFAGDPNDERYVRGTTEDDQSDDGHGSCVYSMAVGPRYGIAKEADVVIVKHATLKTPLKPGEEDTLESATLDGMSRILKDIKDHELKKKAVVNLSFGVSADLEKASKDQFQAIIKELLDNDVVVVTATGNQKKGDKRKEVDDYPALFRKDLTDMIVVGAVDNDGKTWENSQGGDLQDLAAPGVEVVCADGESNKPQVQDGTSFSTASVSGLAAYFLSLPDLKDELQVDGKTAENVKKHIMKLAYARIDDEVKVLYNNEKSDLKD